MTVAGSSTAGSDAAALEAALEMHGLSVAPQERATLARYLALLAKWGGTYNLTAVREGEQAALRHIVDCLLCIEPLRREAPGARTLLDVGSGAGLPGLVIATLLPHVEVRCVDAVAKKVAFIRQAILEMRLGNASAIHGRVERMAGAYDVIASRAFASLAAFVETTEGLLAPGGVWMAMKSRVDDELGALKRHPGLSFHVEPLNSPAELGERNIVWLSHRA